MKISSFSCHALDQIAANREEGMKIAAGLGIQTVEFFDHDLENSSLKKLKEFTLSEKIDVCTLIVVSNFPYHDDEKIRDEKEREKNP